MYVGATQVECPCNVVELCQQHARCTLAQQFVAYAVELVRASLAGIFQRLNVHLVRWHRRTVGPHTLQNVEIGAHCQSALQLQFGLHVLHFRKSHTHTVYTHLSRVAVLRLLRYPLGNSRSVVQTLAHQLKLRAGKLLFGGDEIARVGPQRSRMQCHYSRTCRTVKPRYPLTSLPARWYILAHVRVGTREDKCREMLAAHLLA